MKVLLPTKNKQTGGYTNDHKGYDHDDIPDPNYKSSFFGKVVQAKNSEIRNWIANKVGDPYKPATGTRVLRTEDYGNYIKIKGEVDGKTVYQLGAHFKQGTVLPVGTEVKAGQVVAQIGNTGNSTGAHCHTEYKDEKNVNFPVEFVNQIEVEKPKPMDNIKEQIIIDSYKATTGEYPSDDEKKARLQKNENTTELIEDLLKGDSRSKARWLEIWGVKENQNTSGDEYEQSFDDLREILQPEGLKSTDDTERVKAVVRELVQFHRDHKDDTQPKPKLIIGDKELTYITLGNVVIGVFKK